ncbi:MAG: KH domain-containing protein [Candidatus Woesearchaeota archaeon]
MAEFRYEIKIPKERVAVLIGKKGETKRNLEKATKTDIEIDSKEGDVIVKGEDALGLFSTKEIIRSIGRGFNPEVSMLLLNQDNCFELINLNDYIKSKSSGYRIKARIIGSEGKARKIIEDLTECHICVFGKTIGIIGDVERVALARRAVESLLAGSPHANVYHWLEKQRRLQKNDNNENFKDI